MIISQEYFKRQWSRNTQTGFVTLKHKFDFSLDMEYDGTFSMGIKEFDSATWF
jgi:hypothetical protein